MGANKRLIAVGVLLPLSGRLKAYGKNALEAVKLAMG